MKNGNQSLHKRAQPTRSQTRRKSFTVENATPALGAEITGLDFSEVIRNDDLTEEIRTLWLQRKVLFFRQQEVSAPVLQAFAERFGTLEPHPTAPMHPEASMLLPLYRGVDGSPNEVEKASRENIWHNDLSYQTIPSRGAVLACMLAPSSGGDTLWADMALAYERLPDRIKEALEGLYAKHSLEHYFGAQMPRDKRLKFAQQTPAVEHPVVITHPETQQRALFVNQPFTSHLANYFNFQDVRFGQDFFSSTALLDYLKSQAQHPEFQVRLKWRSGTVAMWDNLVTQHYAVNDYGDAPRKMLRATIKGVPLA